MTRVWNQFGVKGPAAFTLANDCEDQCVRLRLPDSGEALESWKLTVVFFTFRILEKRHLTV